MQNQSSSLEVCPHMGQCNIIIPTPVARAGMKLGDIFTKMIAQHVPGIPFCDESDQIKGRISIKHILSSYYLPSDVLKHAHLLGDYLEHLEISIKQLTHLMQQPVDAYVITSIPTITSSSPLVKALALIRQYKSSYIFVVDDGQYQGVVTMLKLAEFFLQEAKRYE